VKTITIRLPDVEAAMLARLQARDRQYMNLDVWLAKTVAHAYGRLKS